MKTDKISDKIYDEAIELENRMWNREDYAEEHITLFSNIMDFIDSNREAFNDYFDKEK